LLQLANFNPSISGEIMPRGIPSLNEVQKKEIIHRITYNDPQKLDQFLALTKAEF